MSDFSLSRARDKVLPESVCTRDGEIVQIDTDFRTVLRCLRVLDDPDVSDRDKIYLLMRWAFKGAFVQDAFELFEAFLSTGEEADGSPPVMDFEQDADAIYASFMMDYGIDLLEIPFLHWRKFCVLLNGLSEKTPLRCRISLRQLDTKDMKGKAKADAERAKRRVRLKKRIGAEERAIQEEIDQALSKGENPTEAIERLRALYGESK